MPDSAGIAVQVDLCHLSNILCQFNIVVTYHLPVEILLATLPAGGGGGGGEKTSSV
jgi:hypothetical protein